MHRMGSGNIQGIQQAEDFEIELPLVKVAREDVLGALFIYTRDSSELYKDALLKLQTWIINFAEEQVQSAYGDGEENEIARGELKKKIAVISPFTLALYFHWVQLELYAKMSGAEKENYIFEKIPDRFRARFKKNKACRNAREVSPEEETADGELRREEKNRWGLSFAEFLKEVGVQIRAKRKREEEQ